MSDAIKELTQLREFIGYGKLQLHLVGTVAEWIDKRIAELEAQPETARPIVEMRFCEIAFLQLREGIDYRFSADPACEKCRAYVHGKAATRRKSKN